MQKSPYELNRSAYDRIAPRFAEINAAMPSELAAAAGRLIERAGPAPARLLDLGCGAGRDLAWFATHSITGIGSDLSRGMLAQARQVTRAPICQMEMRFLGFASGSFQTIWCCAALLHLPKVDVPRALSEMARVLVPGGFLILSVQKGSGEGVERGGYNSDVDRFFARYQPDEMAGLLEQAGFDVLEQGENISGRHWLWYDAKKVRSKT